MACAFLLTAPSAHAQASTPPTWDVSGSLRARFETLDGQVRPGFNESDSVVSLRSTVFAQYRRGPLRIGGEIYDSRVWGGNRRSPISANDVNTFELVQAYVALDGQNDRLGRVSLQAGRMVLNLGSRRLVAADDFRNTTNGYTGARLDLAPAGFNAALIYVEPQVRLPDRIDALLDNRQRIDRESRDLTLFGGVVSRPGTLAGAMIEGSYFRLDERDAPGRPTRDRELDTYGGRIILAPSAGRWDYELEAFRQTGEISAGLAASDRTLKVRAHFLHADVGYTFVHPWRPRLSATFDLASGDKTGGRFGRFDTLFGMRRADFSPSGIFAAIGRANIVSPGLRLEVTPSPRWDGFLTARPMWLDAAEDSFSTTGVRDPAGRSGRYAGGQIEGRVRYWLIPDRLRAEINGAWLEKGRFLRHAPNAPATGDTHYLAMSVIRTF